MPHCGIINMKCYSVSEAAEILEVDRRTLQRWVRDGFIPAPKAEIVDGQLVKCWSAKEMDKVSEHCDKTYRGKGMDRRKGSRAEQQKNANKK
jgi:excisionase family DNA binding protein